MLSCCVAFLSSLVTAPYFCLESRLQPRSQSARRLILFLNLGLGFMFQTQAIRAFHRPSRWGFKDAHVARVRPSQAGEAQAGTSRCAMEGRELSFPLGLLLELMCSCSCVRHCVQPDSEPSTEAGSTSSSEVKHRWVLMVSHEPRPAALGDCPWPFRQ